jgi:hypothetical protein
MPEATFLYCENQVLTYRGCPNIRNRVQKEFQRILFNLYHSAFGPGHFVTVQFLIIGYPYNFFASVQFIIHSGHQ